MKNTIERSKEGKAAQRQPYIKPQITSVNLIPEEAVLGGCKSIVGCIDGFGQPTNVGGS